MINTHPKMLDEILAEVNQIDDFDSRVNALVSAFSQSYVKYYIDLAVNTEWTTIDVGDVKFKQYGYHRSMCGAALLNRHTVNIVQSVIMRKDIPDRNKLIQVKSLFEMLYESESNILTAILKKNLDSVYPNITFELINSALDKG